jgi:hypothetical protein
MVAPFIKEAFCDERNKIAFAISAGFPTLAAGVKSAYF